MSNSSFRICLHTILGIVFAMGTNIAEAKVLVTLHGLSGDLYDNAAAQLSILSAQNEADISDVYVRSLHSLATKEITNAIKPFGYYDSTVKATLTEHKNGWHATYNVTLGTPITVTNVDININGPAEYELEIVEAIENFPLKKDQRLHHPDYKTGKQKILGKLEKLGFFDAQITTKKIAIDLAQHTAAITLHISSGPRYTIGEITINGNHLAPELLTQLLPFNTGSDYYRNDLITLQSKLSSRRWFTRVAVRPERTQAKDGRIPITIDVSPAEKTAWTGGLGYGTDTGARASLGLDVRWINSRGHSVQFDANGSERERRFIASYDIPALAKDVHQYVGALNIEQQRYTTSSSDKVELSIARHAERGPWQEVLSLTASEDKFTIADTRDTTRLLMPSATWSRYKTDNILDPSKGYAFTVQLRGAAEELASDASFIQGSLYASFIVPISSKHSLLLHGQAAGSITPDFQELPPGVRYFAGGDRSIRGYSFRSQGPSNSDGQVVGGKHLLVGGIEYEYRFAEKWGVAAFVDAGNAFDAFSEPFKIGTGLGMRWRSPIGVIRVDLASAITENGNPIRLHLTLGPSL